MTDIGVCGRCLRRIQHGQAYCSMIPFRGSWGGFMHQYCPPTLRVVRT